MQQGTITLYAALVVSGHFKVVTLNDSGDEAVINLAFPGQFITNFHSSLHGEHSYISIIAGSDYDILKVPLKDFKEFLSPSLLDEYIALFKKYFTPEKKKFTYSISLFISEPGLMIIR